MFHTFARSNQFKHLRPTACISSNMDCSRFTCSSTLHNRIFTGFPWVVSSPNLLWSLSGSLTFWVRISWFPRDKPKQPQTSLLFYFFRLGSQYLDLKYEFHSLFPYSDFHKGFGKGGVITSLVHLWARWFPGVGCCTDPGQTDAWTETWKIFSVQYKNPFLNRSGHLNSSLYSQ